MLYRMELAEYFSSETHMTISYLLSFSRRFSLSSWHCSYAPHHVFGLVWIVTKAADIILGATVIFHPASSFCFGNKEFHKGYDTEPIHRLAILHKWIGHWEHQGTMFPWVSSDKFQRNDIWQGQQTVLFQCDLYTAFLMAVKYFIFNAVHRILSVTASLKNVNSWGGTGPFLPFQVDLNYLQSELYL